MSDRQTPQSIRPVRISLRDFFNCSRRHIAGNPQGCLHLNEAGGVQVWASQSLQAGNGCQITLQAGYRINYLKLY
ncbi:hypothetical protein J6590_069863 [Homalodisca vitripennis]|nr:hypothetical protein J6590_069863 [Homalodisca vitripennis]